MELYRLIKFMELQHFSCILYLNGKYSQWATLCYKAYEKLFPPFVKDEGRFYMEIIRSYVQHNEFTETAIEFLDRPWVMC